jgi:hypothetical protein
MPMTGDGSNSSVLNPMGQMAYAKGGAIRDMLARTPMAMRPNYDVGGGIPSNAGMPNVVDSVPISANAGEFVVKKPSARAVGQSNLNGLNALASQPSQKQQQVRQALHTALSRAATR